MAEGLGRLQPTRRNGTERFHRDESALGFELKDFWAWSVSDLASNATRGRLAEYIVARALGISTAGVRDEWAAYDLVTPSGIKVEVKSAAYLQAWFQRRPSIISFSTKPSRAWNPETNVQSREVTRQADVYVFALLAHLEKATLDPLNVAQWEFYVLSTEILDARRRSQHAITLKSLQALTSPVPFDGLGVAVREAGKRAGTMKP